MKRMMIPLALTLLTLTLLTGCVVVPMAPGGSVYSPPLPPPLAFQAPPVVIVIPDTDNVYVVPDISADLFFWNGFWWRLNNGFWYRSQYYDRGWGYYNNVPTFYHDVDLGWRGYYKNKNWNGHRWNYERIPNLELQQNWKSWQDNRYWESKKRWGVENYQPRPQQQRQELRRQREEQYQKKHQGQPPQDQPIQVHDPKKPPQGQQPQGTPQVQPPQGQQPKGAPYVQPPPPPLAFQAPPVVIVIPDTDNVYVVPDISADLFFWNGFWWRLNNGFWYRSQYYDRGWGYYNNVPTFYHDVDLGWRGYYKNKNWNGHRWNYERIPNLELQQNWKSWQDNRYWESKKRWGVENYQPRPQQQRQELRRQREEQYQKRHQGQPLQDQPPQVHDPKKPPQGQQPQGTPQVQPPQDQPPQVNDPKKPPQDQQPQEHPPQPAQPQGRPEGGR